jgi:hypothetical protein
MVWFRRPRKPCGKQAGSCSSYVANFRDRYSFLTLRWVEVEKPRSGLGTSFRSFRLRRPRPSATGAVGLPGGGDPILLVYRPAAVGLLHARLGHVYPTKSVGLADIHVWSPFSPMTAILSCLARLGTEMPRAFSERRFSILRWL